jgi:hypothetical protein
MAGGQASQVTSQLTHKEDQSMFESSGKSVLGRHSPGVQFKESMDAEVSMGRLPTLISNVLQGVISSTPDLEVEWMLGWI